jgi:comEA protein
MKLPNWMILCVLLVGAMGQYSMNAMANTPATASDADRLHSMTVSSLLPANAPNGNTVEALNINEASAQELASLPGIGAKKAIAIVKYRELNGKFLAVEELTNVKGIGPKMLAKLNGFIAIKTK